MKTDLAFAAAASLLAMATAQTEGDSPYFGVIAARSASPIHLQPLTANGLQIWIGAPTASYCPTNIQEEGGCSNTTDNTNFAGGNGALYMGAEVPGGQQVYIDPVCGAVRYTEAHSAEMPDGAITDGWSLSQGSSFGILSWTDGLIACNTTEGGPWAVYGIMPDSTPAGDCLGFDALTANETEPATWEYI